MTVSQIFLIFHDLENLLITFKLAGTLWMQLKHQIQFYVPIEDR